MVGVMMLALGCRKAPPAAVPPPPQVSVSPAIARQVVDWDQYSGRLEAVETVELRARVGGYIDQAPFEDGSLVKQGDLLFAIDPRPYQATVDGAQAAVAQAEAEQNRLSAEFRRVESLRPTGAASQEEYETKLYQLKASEASVAAARARLDAAQLDLQFTQVTAPISGRVSRKFVTPGNLIQGGAGQATLLTTITSLDPIYIYVDADERAVLRYVELAKQGKRRNARQAPVPAYLTLGDDAQGLGQAGVIDFVDNRVDPATGTLQARAVFPNPDDAMTPGLFARVRVPGSGRYDAVLVASTAVGADQDQKYVMVVDENNVARMRPVKLGSTFGGLVAVSSGLAPGERVIVNGLLRVRPGMAVQPGEAPMPGLESMEALEKMLPPPPETLSMPGESGPTTTVSE